MTEPDDFNQPMVPRYQKREIKDKPFPPEDDFENHSFRRNKQNHSRIGSKYTTHSVSSKKYALSTPIGYLSIGFCLMIYNLTLCDAYGYVHEMLSVVIFYGCITLIIMGIFEFIRGDAFHVMVFTSFGVLFGMIAWIEIMIIWENKNNLDDPSQKLMRQVKHNTKSLGTIFILWAVHNLFYGVLSARKMVTFVVFYGVNMVALIVHAVGVYKDFHDKTELAAGIIGCGAAGAAYYIGFGILLNQTFNRTVFPQGNFINDNDDEFSEKEE